MFGLSEPQFLQLGKDLAGGTVLHCASHVSHIASYWSLKPANVDAVTDLINLATLCRRDTAHPTLVHYVSTISVVADDDADES
jgi:thioester reductase-like protein